MNIAIMTSSFRNQRGGGPEIPCPESIARCKAAGFDIIDMNLCSMKFPERNVFCGDDWEKYLDEVLKAKDEYKVEFCQSHPPYPVGGTIKLENPFENEFFWKMMRRAIEITARVGAPWAVLHPVFIADERDIDKQLEFNHRTYDGIVELAEKLGIGVAFENMIQFPDKPYRFATNAQELNILADSFGSPAVGLCWDFGHANLSVPDKQPDQLREMGSRLKVLHVDDNMGVKDDHFIPFQGNIRWEEIMPVLPEIGFPGHLDLEVAFTNNMPDKLKDQAVLLAAESVKTLLAMARGEQ